jgi:hypothetical protein
MYAVASTCAHGGGVEDRGGVAAVDAVVQSFYDCFQETVDSVWAGELEEGTEGLRSCERMWWEW